MAQADTLPTTVSDQFRPFVCEVCGERFATYGELRDHGRSAGLID